MVECRWAGCDNEATTAVELDELTDMEGNQVNIEPFPVCNDHIFGLITRPLSLIAKEDKP